MKKLDIAQTISMLGNVGVIAGILLLAFELAQNREMTRGQTRATIAQGAVDLMDMYFSDDSTADLIRRGDAGELLSETERVRYDGLRFASFRFMENVHYQYRSGLYEESEYLAQRHNWTLIFSNKGVSELWCRQRLIVSPDFAAEIESLLTTYRCE